MSAGSPPTVPPDPKRLMEVLQFVAELGQVVASNTQMQPILDWMVTRTTAMLAADEGCIRLSDPAAATPGGHTVVRKQREGVASGSWPPAVAMSVEGYLARGREVLASPDLVNDPEFVGLRGMDTRVRSILAVPLRVENRITGVLAVTQATPGRRWNDGEVQLLSIVASSSAGVIEQARLRAVEIERQRLAEERERMDRELATAREIQMSFVPSRRLEAGAWEIQGKVVPARQVGGDAFDYFLVSPERLGFAIADVSGKGIPASLLMSNVQASLRAFCDGRHQVADAVRHINQSLVRTASGKFITLFYGELDLAAGRLRFTNAGHNFPMLRRADGSIQLLEVGGLPLGLLEEAEYVEAEVAFGAEDALLLFSDGVTEALDPFRREFGDERLTQLWSTLAGSSAAAVVDRILSEIQGFRSGADQSDDITVVALTSRSGS
jgi:serine phosphatase RsbU (regulator of sigma subunit)